jgi:hypothetical protein
MISTVSQTPLPLMPPRSSSSPTPIQSFPPVTSSS